MPRMSRVAVGDVVYHVLNRANGRVGVFHTDKEYRHFELLLLEGVELIDMRLCHTAPCLIIGIECCTQNMIVI